MAEYDVIVVGAGNAALAASVAARDAGARRVLVIEKAPRELRGGNTYFSGGLFRFAFEHVDELLRISPEAARLPGFVEGVEPYPDSAFMGDLMRVTEGHADPELAEILVSRSYATVCWMAEAGIKFEPAVSLGGVRTNDVIKWPKGAIIRAVSEGVGLSNMWFAAAEMRDIEIRYGCTLKDIVQARDGRVTGVMASDGAGIREIGARAVVLALGGFEANAAWRAQYLGRPWDHARVRGTKYNQGDGLRIALAAGALPWGQWSGCHATPIDAAAPPFGDRKLTDKTNRLSYPYGLMLNRLGRRFVDEGEDQQFYTYAKFGGIILNQPGSRAYQIFDARVSHLLEARYSTGKPVMADTLADLVARIEVAQAPALDTLAEYNQAAGRGEFDPARCDGMAAPGLTLPKSNWAQRLDQPPFLAYPITGGITFSFGGLKVNQRAQVVGADWNVIPGLYTCGEMVGGLFHYNYPGGSGLMSGATFGRIAGSNAAGE